MTQNRRGTSLPQSGAAALRLLSTAVGEQHDERQLSRRYLAQAGQSDSTEAIFQEVTLPVGIH